MSKDNITDVSGVKRTRSKKVKSSTNVNSGTKESKEKNKKNIFKAMIDKVMSDRKYTWKDFPAEIKSYFTQNIMIYILCSVVALLMSVLYASLQFFLIVMAAIIGFGVFLFSRYLVFAKDKFYFIEGICIAVDRDSFKITKFSNTHYGKSSITIADDKNLYEVAVSHRLSVKINDCVKVYVLKSGIIRGDTENQYKIEPLVVTAKPQIIAEEGTEESN